MKKSEWHICHFRLDPALIRPGRVDVKLLIGHCTEHQLNQMFLRFYPDEPEHRSLEFARAVASDGRPVSAAHVQGFFMFYKDDAQAMLDNVNKIFDQ